MAEQPRHFLPKDLAGALERLDNAEIDALLAAVTAEAEHRGRLPPPTTPNARPQPCQAPAEHGTGSLSTGKLNAVRAASKLASNLRRLRDSLGFHRQRSPPRAGAENLVANAA